MAGDWTQLATAGTFYSPVYGKIDLSPDDLQTMYQNFKTRTPKAPTRLPIDFDHLSDDPQKPGDGQASGWIDDLKIGDDGNSLWMKPEWTRDAAKMIADGKYSGISPFFVTNFIDKASGKKIGPTLRAAALTNRPFLEGMENIPAPTIAASEKLARKYWEEPRVAIPRGMAFSGVTKAPKAATAPKVAKAAKGVTPPASPSPRPRSRRFRWQESELSDRQAWRCE